MSDPTHQYPSPGTNVGNTFMQPDPLLDPGTFIDVDDGPFQNGVTPQPAPAPSSLSKPKKRQPAEMAKRPDWLPESWKIDLRVRSSGNSAGTIDRYYVEPVAGHRFRSKKEVFHFLETGTKRRRKSNSDVTYPDIPGAKGETSSGRKATNSTGFRFDFENPPETMSWILTEASDDVSQDVWTAYHGDSVVPEACKHEWNSILQRVSEQEARDDSSH